MEVAFLPDHLLFSQLVLLVHFCLQIHSNSRSFCRRVAVCISQQCVCGMTGLVIDSLDQALFSRVQVLLPSILTDRVLSPCDHESPCLTA